MKFKDIPAYFGGAYGSAGTIAVECPHCGKQFSYPYAVEACEPIPLPKLGPVCGGGLEEEEEQP